MGKIFFYVYSRNLITIILLMFVSIPLWSYIGFVVGRKYQRIWKIMNLLIFGSVLLLIIYITLGNRTLETKEICLIPFEFFSRAKIQPEIYRSMLMNVFLFFPMGVTLPYMLPDKWRYQTFFVIIFAFMFSGIIEFLQYYFCLGRAETDDVICNTLGCFIGTISYMISKKMVRKKLKIDHKHQ